MPKICLLQESPVFFDKEATLTKAKVLVKQHADCDLIVFPESFVPGYPRGFSFGAVVGSRTEDGRELYAEYRRQSVDLAGEDRTRLEKMARESGAFVIMGVTEMDRSNGTLYCSMLYLSPTHGLVGVHRKTKPTGSERIIWGEAQEPDMGADAGAWLVSVQSGFGRVGGLICWENYMPLARMELYQQGVEIYVAPTADSRTSWTATMQHIAMEGRCFVLGCNQYFTKSMYPDRYRALVADDNDDLCPGGSVIVSPLGEVIAGPLFGEAGALVAEIDLEDIARAKLDFDVVGHYARRDIYGLVIAGKKE
jgi:nitrilase